MNADDADEHELVEPAQLEEVAEGPRGETDERNGAGLFSESAIPFVRRLIEKNRELFEELAKL